MAPDRPNRNVIVSASVWAASTLGLSTLTQSLRVHSPDKRSEHGPSDQVLCCCVFQRQKVVRAREVLSEAGKPGSQSNRSKEGHLKGKWGQ